MKNKTNGILDIDKALDMTIEKYKMSIDEYFATLPHQRIKCELEEEFYILDFLESTNKVFATQYVSLIDGLISQMNYSMRQTFGKMFSNMMGNSIVNAKSENLKYICDKLHICKSFPAYTDYLADIFNEILKLSDKHFQVIVDYLKNIVKLRAEFLDYFIDADVKRVMSSKLNEMSSNVSNARYFFSTFKKILTKKFKIFKNKDGLVYRRSKSVRLLIDMVNRAYEHLEDHFIKYEYQSMKTNIRAWDKGKKADIYRKLYSYTNNFVDVMDYLPSNVKLEIKVLTKVLITGNENINPEYYYLFSVGSTINSALSELEQYESNVFE